jgi:hypothetical protein
MSSFKPRMTIPEAWAQMGACPICDERVLAITHIPGMPEQMTCRNCQASFEMEQDGPSIRLITLPPRYAAFIQPAWQTWMTPVELRRQINQANIPPQFQQSEPQIPHVRSTLQYLPIDDEVDDKYPSDPLTQEEVSKRAAGLAALGNTATEIRDTLSRFNATPDQIEHAIDFIRAQKKNKKSNTPRTIIYVLLILILCLGSAAVILPMLDIPKYIAIIQPIWETLQGSFTQNDVYGGVTGKNPTPVITRTVSP